MLNPHVLNRLTAVMAAALICAAVFMTAVPATAADFKTVNPGELTVAFNGDMPGTGFQDGKLIGLDGGLMQWIADELGLKVKPALMEWSAEIASVKAGRVDIMHGMMSWSIPRTKVILLSDPIYYVKPTITQKKGQNWSLLKDLEGKRVGTITGFNWIDELKRIPGLKLSLYDTSDAAIRDLLAGRIEALLADPPLIQYAIAQKPEWNIHSLPIAEERDDFPILTIKQNVVFGLNKNSEPLLKAINAKIRDAWKNCKNYELAKQYGLGDVATWFDPPGKNYRANADRPGDWTYPKLPDQCK